MFAGLSASRSGGAVAYSAHAEPDVPRAVPGGNLCGHRADHRQDGAAGSRQSDDPGFPEVHSNRDVVDLGNGLIRPADEQDPSGLSGCTDPQCQVV